MSNLNVIQRENLIFIYSLTVWEEKKQDIFKTIKYLIAKKRMVFKKRERKILKKESAEEEEECSSL